MSIRSLLFALTTLFFAGGALAQGEDSTVIRSEYLHQTPGQNFELTPATGAITSRTTYKNTTEKKNTTLIPFLARAEYGFSDMFSLSAVVGMGIGATDNSCTAPATCDDTVLSGLADPVVGANMRIPVGIVALRFGADLSTSVGKRKIESDGDTNLASGGTELTPYFGAEFVVGRSVFGAKISYNLYNGDRSVQDDRAPASTYKTKGDHEIDVDGFYEYNFPRIVAIGGSLGFTDATSSKTESNGVTTSDKNAATEARIGVYVPLRFNPRVTLVPSVSASAADYKSSTVTVKEHTTTIVGVLARFTF